MHWIPKTFNLLEELSVYDATGASANAANSARLVLLREQVSAAYAAYAASPTASTLTSIVNDLKGKDAKALKSNYPKLRSGAKNELGASLLKRSKKCCLCWHAPAGQLDHHLPLTVFPEFSVLTLNLVPVCARCNRVKLDTYRRADGGPSFLHAYRDQLPLGEQFLQAVINVADTVAAEFLVVATESMPAAVFETLESHFKTLELAEIYGNLAAELVVEKLTPIYEYFDHGGGIAVKRYLALEARGVVRQHGVNHWKPVLLHALANDTAFCDGGFMSLGERDESIFDFR